MYCEICGVKASNEVRLVRDHDHNTGFIRGFLCDPCNGRLGTYEHRKVKPRKAKGRYREWLEKYQTVVDDYLSKEPSGKQYKKRINERDLITGFTKGQMRGQARSTKSEFRFQARERLAELNVSY